MTLEATLRELVREMIREELVGTAGAAADRLLSIEEAADALGIGRTATYNELQAGRLRSLKVGRRRLVPSGAVADYIARALGT